MKYHPLARGWYFPLRGLRTLILDQRWLIVRPRRYYENGSLAGLLIGLLLWKKFAYRVGTS
jgi:hypothetical protein